MKATSIPVILAALLAGHATAFGSFRQLRGADDALGELVPDAMVLGSPRSSSRLVAVSSADGDSATMATALKTLSRAREREALPASGSSARLAKGSLVVRSDATSDAATMTTTSATAVRADDPPPSEQ